MLDIELTPGGGKGFLTLLREDPGGGEVIDEIIVTFNFSKELERLVSDQNK